MWLLKFKLISVELKNHFFSGMNHTLSALEPQVVNNSKMDSMGMEHGLRERKYNGWSYCRG
jgi:hypothetical protein